MTIFGQMNEATKKIVSEIATDDIKVNRIWYEKRSSLEYVKEIIKRSENLLRGDNYNG